MKMCPHRNFPRRSCLDLFCPAEKAIFDAVQAVEQTPAHPRLTEAVILLQKAKDQVSDFVDDVPAKPQPEYLKDQTSDLPPNMLIKFIECPKGHGRLHATNWVDSGCPHCKTEQLNDRLHNQGKLFCNLLSSARELDNAIAKTYWTSDDGEKQRDATPEDLDDDMSLISEAWRNLRIAVLQVDHILSSPS